MLSQGILAGTIHFSREMGRAAQDMYKAEIEGLRAQLEQIQAIYYILYD